RTAWTAGDREPRFVPKQRTEPRPDQLEAVPGRYRLTVEPRPIVRDRQPDAAVGSRGANDDRSSLPARRDRVFDTIFDERLQRERRDLHARERLVEPNLVAQSRAKSH